MNTLMKLTLALLPSLTLAGGFDTDTFDSWVKMRTGGSNSPVYWYAVGRVYSYPDGELLMTMEGIDTARALADEDDANRIYQLSRKTFVYRDADTGELLTQYKGNPVTPIAYPYQLISYELKGDKLETWVEQGSGKRLQRIGPGTSIDARRAGDDIVFSAPLFLDLETPAGPYQAFEHYDFLYNPDTGDTPKCSWIRYGDLPPWAGGGPSIMHMVTWRIDEYEQLPASMRTYLESEARMWMSPPEDMAAIRALQAPAP